MGGDAHTVAKHPVGNRWLRLSAIRASCPSLRAPFVVSTAGAAMESVAPWILAVSAPHRRPWRNNKRFGHLNGCGAHLGNLATPKTSCTVVLRDTFRVVDHEHIVYTLKIHWTLWALWTTQALRTPWRLQVAGSTGVGLAPRTQKHPILGVALLRDLMCCQCPYPRESVNPYVRISVHQRIRKSRNP